MKSKIYTLSVKRNVCIVAAIGEYSETLETDLMEIEIRGMEKEDIKYKI